MQSFPDYLQSKLLTSCEGLKARNLDMVSTITVVRKIWTQACESSQVSKPCRLYAEQDVVESQLARYLAELTLDDPYSTISIETTGYLVRCGLVWLIESACAKGYYEDCSALRGWATETLNLKFKC